MFAGYLADQGMPTDVAAISREHVEAFITDQLAGWRPATAANRYRGLQRFFPGLVDEGEIKVSPMARMRPPQPHGPSLMKITVWGSRGFLGLSGAQRPVTPARRRLAAP